MHYSIKKHKTPIAVTGVGLVAAFSLAIAPVLMAESETDKRAESNTAAIEKLIASIDGTNSDLEERMTALMSNSQGQFSSYDNQIKTLNKATTRLHQRQRSIQQPNGVIRSSINQLAKNSDARMINLEKAVMRLHKKQRERAAVALSAENNNENPAKELSSMDGRLASLEQTVKDMESKQAASATAVLTSTGAKPQSSPDQTRRLDALERTIRQFVMNQNVLDSAGDTRLETAIRKDVEIDFQLKKIERTLTQLEMRLDDFEDQSRFSSNRYGQSQFGQNRQRRRTASRQHDPVIDQLFEIRSTVNSLLNEISR